MWKDFVGKLRFHVELNRNNMFKEYDLIVIVAGHAGCEAASAAASMGSSVLLVTMNMNTIAQMSCNPAIGGVDKGKIVREIDAVCVFFFKQKTAYEIICVGRARL